MRIFALVMALFVYLNLGAQQTAVITGNITNAVMKEVVVEVNRVYLDNTTVIETSTLNASDNFSFVLEINIPQLVVLEYARNRTTLYIEPGGDLHIVFDANSFKHSMVFGGKCGTANDFLREFRHRFPEETNRFLMKQLKKGIVYYETDEQLEQKMRTLGHRTFTREMEDQRLSKKFMLDQFERNKGGFPSLFKTFINAEIDYDWGFKMMMYGYSFQNLHNIPETYFDFANQLSISNDDALGNEKYRKFLVGYVNMRYDKSGQNGNPYTGQYEMAKELVDEASLAFFQADILVRSFRKNELAIMLPTYNEFVKTVPYNEFYLRAVDAYFQKKPYAIGSPAPDFSMKDAAGNTVTLQDYKGKVVVMNFWASWCRPCINKIEDVKLVRQWVGEDVVFLNISLERDSENFHEEISKRDLNGMVNIFAENGLESNVTTAYDVKAIPEFFIIGRTGNFARKPDKTDAFTLEKHLKQLVGR